jgi:hypothetical protein
MKNNNHIPRILLLKSTNPLSKYDHVSMNPILKTTNLRGGKILLVLFDMTSFERKALDLRCADELGLALVGFAFGD